MWSEVGFWSAIKALSQAYPKVGSYEAKDLENIGFLFKIVKGEREGMEGAFLKELQQRGHFPILEKLEAILESTSGRKYFDRTLLLIDHLDASGFVKNFFFMIDKSEGSLEEIRKFSISFLREFPTLQGSRDLLLSIAAVLGSRSQKDFCYSLLNVLISLYQDQRMIALKRILYNAKPSDQSFMSESDFRDERLVKKILRVGREFEASSLLPFSEGQVASKKWLIDELNALDGFLPENPKILVLGGWHGLLPRFLFDLLQVRPAKIRSLDIDKSCEKIADTYNKEEVIDGWRFKAITSDMFQLDYVNLELSPIGDCGQSFPERDQFDLIINTSCEHLENFSEWFDKIPSGQKLVLQSNDFFDEPEHVNCDKSLEDFARKAPLHLSYQGELKLEKYTRFMLIGIKK